MSVVVSVYDIVEANGKTIRENNLEKPHKFALGEMVEVDLDIYNLDDNGMEVNLTGKCVLYITSQYRDCDGTPLYTVSDFPCVTTGMTLASENHKLFGVFSKISQNGIGENSLTSIGKTVTLHEDMRSAVKKMFQSV